MKNKFWYLLGFVLLSCYSFSQTTIAYQYQYTIDTGSGEKIDRSNEFVHGRYTSYYTFNSDKSVCQKTDVNGRPCKPAAYHNHKGYETYNYVKTENGVRIYKCVHSFDKTRTWGWHGNELVEGYTDHTEVISYLYFSMDYKKINVPEKGSNKVTMLQEVPIEVYGEPTQIW